MAQQFRLVLKSGPDNITPYKEDATQSFKRGELIKITDNTEVGAATGNSIEDGILGIAAKDGQNTATPPNKAEIYVITPEQVWELHVAKGVAPTAYALGANYEINQTTESSYTITREAETTSATVSIRGPVLAAVTKTATANQGVILIGYSSDATKAKKGQKVLIRFPGEATVNK